MLYPRLTCFPRWVVVNVQDASKTIESNSWCCAQLLDSRFNMDMDTKIITTNCWLYRFSKTTETKRDFPRYYPLSHHHHRTTHKATSRLIPPRTWINPASGSNQSGYRWSLYSIQHGCWVVLQWSFFPIPLKQIWISYFAKLFIFPK